MRRERLVVAVLLATIVVPCAYVVKQVRAIDRMVAKINQDGGKATALCEWVRIPFEDQVAEPILEEMCRYKRPEHLELIRNPGDKALECIAGMTWLKSLEIYECRSVTDNGVKYLEALAELERIKVSGTAVTNAGVASLCEIRGLKRVSIQSESVDHVGMGCIFRIPGIQVVQMKCPEMSDLILPDVESATQLREVQFLDGEISERGIKALESARPDLRVRYRLKWGRK